MPIGADLTMHEEREPEKVRTDGARLGRVIERTARRWGTPLAVPLMDLRLEKTDLLALAGIAAAAAETFQFKAPLTEAELTTLCGEQTVPFCAGSLARDEALAYIRTKPDLVAVGMAIGPFSLTTRLLADPITATAMAGKGVEAEDSDEVRAALAVPARGGSGGSAFGPESDSARRAGHHDLRAGGVHRVHFAAADEGGSNLFERLVMEPNLRLKAALDEAGCDLIFHDCGELIDPMVEAFAHRLHPVMLSFGSSRKLWEDARLVPADVVLYGNLPTR